MSIPAANDFLRFEGLNEESASGLIKIEWSQSLKTRTASYYIIKAKNTSKNNADVLLYVQQQFFQDESSPDYIGKIPGAMKEGGDWIVPITDRFQYGQKNAQGENRWVVLHDKNNKLFQHRFLVTTIQGNAAQWVKTLANSFGAGDLADQLHKMGSRFIGDYLKTF